MNDPDDLSRSGSDRPTGRKRRLLLRLMVWSLVLLVVLASVLWFVLRGDWIRRYGRQVLIDRVSQTLDRPIELGAVDFDLFPLSAWVTDVVIPGPEPGDPPVLTAERVWVELSLAGGIPYLMRGSTLTLEQIEIDEPVIHIELYEDGSTNLPDWERTSEGGKVIVRLERLLVADGFVELEEYRLPLSVDARGIVGRVLGDDSVGRQESYAFQATAESTRFVLPQTLPWEGALRLQGTFASGRIDLDRVVVSGEDLTAQVEGAVTWAEGARAVAVDVSAEMESSLANRLGWLEEPVEGALTFDGDFFWNPDDWRYGGLVRAERIDFMERTFRDLSARVAGTAGEVLVEVDEVEHAGGRLTGTVELAMEEAEDGGRQGEVELRATGLDLARLLGDLDLPLRNLTGGLGGTFSYRFTTAAPLEGSGAADLRLADVSRPGEALSVSGRVPLTIDDGVVRIDDARLTAPEQTVTASGSFDVSDRSGTIDYQLETADLGRLVSLLPIERSDEGVGAWLPTAGTGTATGTARFGDGEVSTDVTFDLAQVVTPELTLPTLAGSLRYTPERVEDLDVVAALDGGTVGVTGSVEIPGRLDLAVTLDDVPASEVDPFLPETLTAYELAGDVSGTLQVGGTFEDLQLSADLTSDVFSLRGIELAGVAAAFDLRGGRLENLRLSASRDGGTLVATGALGAEGPLDLALTLESWPVESLTPFLPPNLAELRVEGDVSGTLALGGSFEDLAVQADLEAAPLSVRGLTIDRLAADFSFRDGRAEDLDVRATVDGGALRVTGDAGVAGPLDLTIALEEFPVETLTPFLPPNLRQVEVAGDVTGVVQVAGTAQVPSIRADVEAAPLTLADVVLDRLSAELAYAGGRIEGLDLTARRGDSTLEARGTGGLVGPLDLTLTLDEWPAETLTTFLPQLPEVTAELTGRVQVTGTAQAPQVAGTLSAAPFELAGFRFDRIEADLSTAEQRIRLDRLELVTEAGSLVASGFVDLARQRFAIEAEGRDLALGEEPFAGRIGPDLEGRIDLSAALSGPFADPEGRLVVTARELSLDGQPLGEGGASSLALDVRGDRLDVEGSLLGLLDFEGGGRLDRQEVDLTIAVASDQLGALAALVGGESLPDLGGVFEGVVTVTGSPESLATLDARMVLDPLALEYEGLDLVNLEPVVAELSQEELVFRSLFLGVPGTDTELFVGGRIGLTGEAPLALQVQASIPADWTELMLPAAEVEGRLDVLATIGGTLTDPRLNGQGEIRDGQVILAAFPHSLNDVSGVVLFYPDQIVLDSLRGELGGGRIRAAGRIELPGRGEELVYRLQAQAQDVSIRWPEGFLIRGDAEIVVTPLDDGRELSGVVRLSRAFYLQDVPVSFGQLLQRVFERQRLDVGETDPVLASTQVALAIEGPDALRVRNNVADLTGDVDLVIRGTLARPVVFGQVELDPGGELVFQDNDYEVVRGLLTFANPQRLDPVIDLVAETEVAEYDIQLSVSGTLDRLRTSFRSDPPLADLEVLQLLTTGSPRGIETAVAGGGGEGSFAEAFLFGQATSALSRRFTTLFGFDKFRLTPGSGGGTTLGVTLEERIGEDVFVAYTTSPGGTEEELLQVGWEISDQLTLIFSREGEDVYAVDARWEKNF